jgi:GTP-binding protein LepA
MPRTSVPLSCVASLAEIINNRARAEVGDARLRHARLRGHGLHENELVKLRILVNNEEVDALSSICLEDQAESLGRATIQSLRKEIPRHLFEIPIQAAIESGILLRENIAALRKDVLAKCTVGDVTRKRKLLEKQKEGKRRMRQVGNVDIPQKAFLAVLGDREGDAE